MVMEETRINLSDLPKELPQECPWCHKVPDIVKKPLWSEIAGDGYHGYYGNFEYFIECVNPECKIQPRSKAYNDIYNFDASKCIKSCINDWNTR